MVDSETLTRRIKLMCLMVSLVIASVLVLSENDRSRGISGRNSDEGESEALKIDDDEEISVFGDTRYAAIVDGMNLSQSIEPMSNSKTLMEDFKLLEAIENHKGLRESLRFFPNRNFLLCQYPKTGTTSVLQYIYKGIFGTRFPGQEMRLRASAQNGRECFIHNSKSSYWHNEYKTLGDLEGTEALSMLQNSSVYKFVVERDPVIRLISSWRSKVRCGEHVDKEDRSNLVFHLLNLAGQVNKSYSVAERKHQGKSVTCLSFDEFAGVIEFIYPNHLVTDLDPHFAPQNCFKDLIMYDDEFMTSKLETESFQQLAKVARFPSDVKLETTHKSSEVEADAISTRGIEKLKKVVSTYS